MRKRWWAEPPLMLLKTRMERRMQMVVTKRGLSRRNLVWPTLERPPEPDIDDQISCLENRWWKSTDYTGSAFKGKSLGKNDKEMLGHDVSSEK